jgi:hypothetical protein
MRNVVLVDFDGVVLKGNNKLVSSFMNKKVCNYVQRKTCINNRDLVQVLNNEVYASYGHTVLGLKKHNIKADILEFNSLVYSDVMAMRELKFTSEEKDNWVAFMDEMEKCDLNVQFFSNASMTWIKHFIGQDYKDGMFDLMTKISEHRYKYLNDELLKPEMSIYDFVMKEYPRRLYYMLDDKIINFGPVCQDPRWVKMWVSGVSDASIKPSSAFFSVSDIVNAADLIQRCEDNINTR